MFAYRLVSGHWRVQTGVWRIGEEGTVTTAGVFGLNVLTGWEQRRPEWADVAWLVGCNTVRGCIVTPPY